MHQNLAKLWKKSTTMIDSYLSLIHLKMELMLFKQKPMFVNIEGSTQKSFISETNCDVEIEYQTIHVDNTSEMNCIFKNENYQANNHKLSDDTF